MKFILSSLALVTLLPSQSFSSESSLLESSDYISQKDFGAKPKIIFEKIAKETVLTPNGDFAFFNLEGADLPKVSFKEGTLSQLFFLDYKPLRFHQDNTYTYHELFNILDSSKILSVTDRSSFHSTGRWVTKVSFKLQNSHAVKEIILGFHQISPKKERVRDFFV